jgi:hypothetical protein
LACAAALGALTLLLLRRGGDAPEACSVRCGRVRTPAVFAATARTHAAHTPALRTPCCRPATLPQPPAFAAARWPAATHARFDAEAAAAAASHDTSFTVLLNTFKRRDLLRRAVAHYATCGPQVGSIRVVWSEQVPPPSEDNPGDAPYFAASAPARRPGLVRYDAHPSTSLNNRFTPLRDVAASASLGAAVFSVDDDMVVPCAALADAFAAWRAAPHALVGFYPRLHVAKTPTRRRATSPSCASDAPSYAYVSAEPALAWHGRFSIILTKAAFLHAEYLSLYTHAMPAVIRDYVSARRECEDIAMAFLIANATGGAPPVWVAPPFRFWAGAKLDGLGRKGISSGGVAGHHAMRGRCVEDFSAMYGGRVPLVVAPLADAAPRAPPAHAAA